LDRASPCFTSAFSLQGHSVTHSLLSVEDIEFSDQKGTVVSHPVAVLSILMSVEEEGKHKPEHPSTKSISDPTTGVSCNQTAEKKERKNFWGVAS
jgi:hypothetical protein